MSEAPDIAGIYHRLEMQDQHMVDMWRSVVAQGIRDMDLAGRRHRNTETIQTELDALTWIGTPDFRISCACALIDPTELQARLKEIILMKAPYRRLLLRDLADMIREPPPRLLADEAYLDADLADEPDLTPGD